MLALLIEALVLAAPLYTCQNSVVFQFLGAKMSCYVHQGQRGHPIMGAASCLMSSSLKITLMYLL